MIIITRKFCLDCYKKLMGKIWWIFKQNGSLFITTFINDVHKSLLSKITPNN